MGPAAGRWLQHQRVADSAVVGSIIAWTSEIRFVRNKEIQRQTEFR